MKRTVTTFLLCLICLAAAAQRPVQKFELELNAGYPVRIFPEKGTKHANGLSMAVDFRYNIPETIWSFGAEAAITGMEHRITDESMIDLSDDVMLRMSSLSLISECNPKRGKNISFYCGAGAGIAEQIQSYPSFDQYKDVPTIFPNFQIRTGVEFINRFRISAIVRIGSLSFTNASINLSYKIGGKPKTEKNPHPFIF